MILKLDSITKDFGAKRALNSISLSIEGSKVVALIGPNGSGKTTLLRIIDMLEKPSSGRITYNGQSVSNIKSQNLNLQRRIGMVFQTPTLFSGTVYHNVAYGLKIRKFSENRIRDTVKESLADVNLTGFEKMDARILSGGESQRVAIARILAYSPELLLLDEPASNLDPVNVGIIEDTIKSIVKSRKTSIIVATHNMFEAQRLSDETVFLLNGKIIEQDATIRIFQTPKNDATTQFISGRMVY